MLGGGDCEVEELGVGVGVEVGEGVAWSIGVGVGVRVGDVGGGVGAEVEVGVEVSVGRTVKSAVSVCPAMVAVIFSVSGLLEPLFCPVRSQWSNPNPLLGLAVNWYVCLTFSVWVPLGLTVPPVPATMFSDIVETENTACNTWLLFIVTLIGFAVPAFAPSNIQWSNE